MIFSIFKNYSFVVSQKNGERESIVVQKTACTRNWHRHCDGCARLSVYLNGTAQLTVHDVHRRMHGAERKSSATYFQCAILSRERQGGVPLPQLAAGKTTASS